MDNPNDVKELIPEFFYFPEFLENQNGESGVIGITFKDLSVLIIVVKQRTSVQCFLVHKVNCVLFFFALFSCSISLLLLAVTQILI